MTARAEFLRQSQRTDASNGSRAFTRHHSCCGLGTDRRIFRGCRADRQSAEWWQNYFDSQYLLEYEPLFSLERDRHEAARLIDVLGLPSGSRILDVPCGQGRHAHLLAEAGFDVDGLDYSADLLAARESAGHREDACGTRAATCARCRRHGRAASTRSSTSSRRSAFSPTRPTTTASSHEFARVLKPGGVLVWHGGNRDGVMARFSTAIGGRPTTERWSRTSAPSTRCPACSRCTRSGPARRDVAIASTRFGSTRRPASPSFAPTRDLIVEQAYEGFTSRPSDATIERNAARRAEDATRRARCPVNGAAASLTPWTRADCVSSPQRPAPQHLISFMRPIRVLVAKPGLDGHDRGAKVVAAALRDAGMEVIYTGLHQTPEMIATAAVQEDVDVVGLSILSGAHMTLFPRVLELLHEQGRDDILITGGGIIPKEDMDVAAATGASASCSGPGTRTSDLIDYIRDWFAERERQEA